MTLATAGLCTGPVSSTAFDPAAFSFVTTSPLTAVQFDGTAISLLRRTDSGPRARSGS